MEGVTSRSPEAKPTQLSIVVVLLLLRYYSERLAAAAGTLSRQSVLTYYVHSCKDNKSRTAAVPAAPSSSPLPVHKVVHTHYVRAVSLSSNHLDS